MTPLGWFERLAEWSGLLALGWKIGDHLDSDRRTLSKMTLPLGLWLAVFAVSLVGVIVKDWRALAVVLALSIVALGVLFLWRR